MIADQEGKHSQIASFLNWETFKKVHRVNRSLREALNNQDKNKMLEVINHGCS